MRFIFFVVLLFNTIVADEEYNRHHKHIAKDLSNLGLTSNQSIKAKEILKEYRLKLHEYREQKEKLEKQKQEIFAKDNFDIKLLEDLDTKLSKLKIQLELDLLSKFHNLLTSEQRNGFIEYIEDWEVE